MSGKKGRSGRKPGDGLKPEQTVLAPLPRLEGEKPASTRPPTKLSPSAKREYRRVATLMVGRQHWREDFRAALAMYAAAWDDWTVARAAIEADGLMVQLNGGGLTESPWVAIAERAEARMMRVGKEMGLTLVGMSRGIPKKRQRERVVVDEGKVGIEREAWGGELLA